MGGLMVDNLRDELRDAIGDAVRKDTSTNEVTDGMMTAFVVVVEMVGTDGMPYLMHQSEDQPMWKSVGMLECTLLDYRHGWNKASDRHGEVDTD